VRKAKEEEEEENMCGYGRRDRRPRWRGAFPPTPLDHRGTHTHTHAHIHTHTGGMSRER